MKEIEKGKLRKLTNATFNDGEWMTIQKPPGDNEAQGESNEPMSLIDAFTADIQDSDVLAQSSSVSSYKVSTSVGTLIANKLFNGEKIRVGVNGKFINEKTDNIK